MKRPRCAALFLLGLCFALLTHTAGVVQARAAPQTRSAVRPAAGRTAAPPAQTLKLDLQPNDQEFSQQWALPMMQVPYAWDLLKGSSSVVVGVLDSGVDPTAPDLAGRVLPIGCNVVADHTCPADGHGTPATDSLGHGTQVAGIIAAQVNNSVGIAGVAWNASILPVRITDGDTGLVSDFVTGLRWAVDHGANVLNFSFSMDCGTSEPPEMRDALAYAWSHGALPVAAAGNDSGCPQGVFPAADKNVIAVDSTDMNDHPSKFDNFGPWVGASAPGEHIISTSIGGLYTSSNGTSVAAPMVAGLAALLFAVPGATNTSVRNWILSTCDVPDGWNPAYGCGRINAYRAVSLAVRGVDPHGASTAPVKTHLVNGLNNVLYLGPTRTVDTALADLAGTYTSVYAWDPVRDAWSAYLPGHPSASDLQLLVERSAYWITVKNDVDLTMHPPGDELPPQLTLAAGWNNLLLPAGSPGATMQAFSASVPAIFGWSPGGQSWNAFFAGAPPASDLAQVRPDAPYWVYVPASVVVTYHH